MIQFDEHIFQLGWFNHQLVIIFFNDHCIFVAGRFHQKPPHPGSPRPEVPVVQSARPPGNPAPSKRCREMGDGKKRRIWRRMGTERNHLKRGPRIVIPYQWATRVILGPYWLSTGVSYGAPNSMAENQTGLNLGWKTHPYRVGGALLGPYENHWFYGAPATWWTLVLGWFGSMAPNGIVIWGPP